MDPVRRSASVAHLLKTRSRFLPLFAGVFGRRLHRSLFNDSSRRQSAAGMVPLNTRAAPDGRYVVTG